MTSNVSYGEPAAGYDVFGEKVSLLPERRPAKLEITRPGMPTYQQQFEAGRRAVVQAEDDAYEKTGPFERDFCQWLLFSYDVQLRSIKRHIEAMKPHERRLYGDALISLAYSLREVAAAIDHQYPVTPDAA